MKTVFLLSLFIIITNSWSQNLETRITNVENRLTFPKTVDTKNDIQISNIIKRLKDEKIPGASIAVVNNGKIEWSKTYGTSEIDKTTLVDSKTLFQ